MKNWLFAGMLVISWAGISYAGSLGMTSIGFMNTWEPDCYKPSVPYFYVSDVESYNQAVSEYNAYVSEVEAYLQCVQGEAEADIQAMVKAVQEGAAEAEEGVLADLNSARSSLELAGSSLQ
ncbi:MAG: hypothetical protein H0S80_04960 [Desulfovibrionaceae bacterium]|nr:hypothetical protein [Desulfovibrionaceae bacterium]